MMDWILVAITAFFLVIALLNYFGLLDILELAGGIFGLLFALIGLIFAVLTRDIRKLTRMIDPKMDDTLAKDDRPQK